MTKYVYPPFSDIYRYLIEIQKKNNLKGISKDIFWENLEDSNDCQAIKITVSPDLSLAYIDFFDLKRTKLDYAGPKLPLKIITCKFI